MADFNKKVAGKKTIGNRQINSDEALGLVCSDVSDAKLLMVKINALIDNPYQPRLSMDEEALSGLAESIEQSGLLQPIIITPLDGNPNKFYIVAGHRRVAATKSLGKDSIEAIVINIDNEKMKLNALLENLQREDLSPLEEALAVKALIDSGIKQSDIAVKLGKTPGFVSQLVKITTLSPALLAYITENHTATTISMLYELTALKNPEKQFEAFLHIDKKSMTREHIREYIKSLNDNSSKKTKPKKNTFSGFQLTQSKNKKKVSIKLDLDKLEDRSEAIKTLEYLLSTLKKEASL